MKVLSVKQPWAWAIAKGYKTIENRSRATSHRGPLAIHSSARWDDPEVHWLGHVVRTARSLGHTLPAYLKDDQPYCDTGLVLAVVDVVDVCTVSRDDQLADCECGPWASVGETHWKLANARLLPEPIPAKGRLADYPCGDMLHTPGDPCKFCGKPTPLDGWPCPDCWTPLNGMSMADLKATFARADLSLAAPSSSVDEGNTQ